MPSLKDYRPYPFTLSDTTLAFDIEEGATQVRCTFNVARKPDAHPEEPLYLDGQASATRGGERVRVMDLLRVSFNGRDLTDNEYTLDDSSLSIFDVGDGGEVAVETRICPEENTEMLGLYKTAEDEDDLYLTQNEAQGFRRITFYPDRPDVGSTFTVSVTADAARYPVLLSNGNLMSEKTVAGRRTAVWHDPFRKPCYLFALVAGDLAVTRGSFLKHPDNPDEQPVMLEIYTKPGDREHCDHPMKALKAAMQFDQDRFDRFYDLDRYMIVAVKSFLYGAMENKGLNIFNISRLIASKDIATDDNFLDVERVVSHEYFHNFSGNRVSIRDFLQIALKEGFTVFRDQEFTASLTSDALQRIIDVTFLRRNQFLEDASALAHPVQPKELRKVENAYTTTIYYKGAELVRMLQTILGRKRFKNACNKYFEDYDGQSVTIEHFLQAMRDVSGIDLEQFRLWYDHAGTPVLSVSEHATERGIRLDIEQSCPSTPGHPEAEKPPFHIPVAIGFVGPRGEELLGAAGNRRVRIESSALTEFPNNDGTAVLHLKAARTTVAFEGLPENSSLSFLRSFSAPVTVNWNRSPQTLVHLAKFDGNEFGRWDSAQKLASAAILAKAESELDPAIRGDGSAVVESFLGLARYLAEVASEAPDDGQAKTLIAHMLTLPSEMDVLLQAPGKDIRSIADARDTLIKRIASLEVDWEALAHANRDEGPYSRELAAVARRKLKGVAMGYAARHLDANSPEHARELVLAALHDADNLTDRLISLNCLLRLESIDDAEKSMHLDAFLDAWKNQDLVVDAWFSTQAACSSWASLDRIEELSRHVAFRSRNPNRLRALYGGFANANVHFHDPGSYQWYANTVLVEVDAFAPVLAAAFARPLSCWTLLDLNRGRMMRQALESLRRGGLSEELGELIERSLENVAKYRTFTQRPA